MKSSFARQIEVRYASSAIIQTGDRGAILKTPLQVAAVLRPIFAGRVQESFVTLHLDGRHRLIGWEETARGGTNVVCVSPREVFRGALLSGAAAIIVAHNHPSGDPTPSDEDRELTSRLRTAAELIGVPMPDHVVWAEGGFYSFSDGR